MQTIKHNGLDLTLTQDAYSTGGTVYLGDGSQYNGPRYQAAATDANGNAYMVYWFEPAVSEDGDESNACDWDNPDHVTAA